MDDYKKIKLSRFLKISRPFSMWPLLAGFYLIGIGGIKTLSNIHVVEIVFFTFFLNFYINGINDIYDIDSDKNNPNKESWVEGVALKNEETKTVFVWAIIFALLFVIVSIITLKIEHILLSVFYVVTMFAYSYRNKYFRIKERAIWDFIIGGPILFLTPTLIAFSAKNSLKFFPAKLFIFALPFMAFHLISALRDEEADKKASVNTTAVMLGKRKSILLASTFIIVSLIFSYFFKLYPVFILLGFQFLYLIYCLRYGGAGGDIKFIKGFMYIFVLSCLVVILYYSLVLELITIFVKNM